MSTIRYTAGGDYDPHHSVDITPTSESLYSIQSDDTPWFDAYDLDGNMYQLPAYCNTDGIYADLRDNTYNSFMEGGDLRDVLIGGPLDDYIGGGNGNDVIRGGPGDDSIVGEGGADYLHGGAGADRFDFSILSDFGTKQHPDVIADFSGVGGEGDKIDLGFLGPFEFVGSAKFDGHGTGELRAIAHGKGYLLEGDYDGDGQTDFVIEVRSAHRLTADDFEWYSNSPRLQASEVHLATHPAFAPAHGTEHLAIV